MDRSRFIKTLGLATLAMPLVNFKCVTDGLAQDDIMPALFIGHGSPMNAIEHNAYTKAMNQVGEKLRRPQAILVISAHWLTRGTYVATTDKPETIHDFGGFPEELFKQQYPAPGAPDMAKTTMETIHSIGVQEDHHMGLDHGAWSVLKHLFPMADIPVFQMSIDYTKPPAWHFELAKELTALRKKGVLIIGSGNIVHNLGIIDWNENAPVLDWAADFDNAVKQRLDKKQFSELSNYGAISKSAGLAVPSNDHYLPMLYIAGLCESKEETQYIFEGFQNASISMRSFGFGHI